MSTNTAREAPARTLLILGAGTLAFVLAQTTVIPALADMQRALGASASGIAWMVTAYLLVASIATPISAASATCSASSGCWRHRSHCSQSDRSSAAWRTRSP
jgi:predicted MFS family arabinose efflux permease